MKYATRINSFLRFDSNLLNAFRSIGSIEGVDYVDLNYPEHFADYDIEVIKAKMEECGLRCNAINLRFRDKYIGGEFGNHEPAAGRHKFMQGGGRCVQKAGRKPDDYMAGI